MDYRITEDAVSAYEGYLRREERAANTVSKYLHDLRAFALWLGDRPVTKEAAAGWKEQLRGSGSAAVTVNAALAALHSFFAFAGLEGCRVRYLKRQRQVFRDTARELTQAEYGRLVEAAKAKGNRRLALLLEAICGTGIRVSEVAYITVEAVQRGRAEISLKGKIRTVLIPGRLAQKLQKYARKQRIVRGEIFLTAGGRPLSRRQIWSEMKALCPLAGVDATKVFPHNLRHLFARVFYRACRDIVRLADVLGHSSIETTRIYLVTTGAEYARQLDRLGLIS